MNIANAVPPTIVGEMAEANSHSIITGKLLRQLDQLRGTALEYFSTHADLVKRQKAAKAAKAAGNLDGETWKGDIADETDALSSN